MVVILTDKFSVGRWRECVSYCVGSEKQEMDDEMVGRSDMRLKESTDTTSSISRVSMKECVSTRLQGEKD